MLNVLEGLPQESLIVLSFDQNKRVSWVVQQRMDPP